MTRKTTGKAREVSHAVQVCTDMFLHDVKRTIVLWAAVYHAQRYGNTGRWTCLQWLREKKKTAGDNGSLLFSRLCCVIWEAAGSSTIHRNGWKYWQLNKWKEISLDFLTTKTAGNFKKNKQKKNICCGILFFLMYIFSLATWQKRYKYIKWGNAGGGEKGGEEGGVHANLLPAPITSVSGAW